MKTIEKFAAAINCIDGRVQIPVADWMKMHTHVQYVDMITEPGADKVLASGDDKKISDIAEKVRISVNAHYTEAVALAGHFDCAANPVDFERHLEQIKEGVEKIRSWGLKVRVLGLYVNEWNSVDLVFDTDAEIPAMRSFL